MLNPFSCRLRVIFVLILITILDHTPVQAASETQTGIVKKIYFNPGSEVETIKFFTDRYPNTKVLYNFSEEVGTTTAVLNDIDDAGYYSLKVINVNGSFVDDIWIYHAIPSWLCKFSPEEYLLTPVKSEFALNRTALIPCTIMGTPQPTFSWEKYDTELETWVNINTFDEPVKSRYYQSELGHLYIKHFELSDTGKYRCRARNRCGGRCPHEKQCTLKDVLGDHIDLTVAEDTDEVSQYFLNPVINQCWDSEGVHDRNDRNCSGLSANAGHIYSFSQYTPVNSSAILEAFFDFRRPQNDGMDQFRIGTVKWNKVRDLSNFYPIEDETGKSGICIAKIEGFKKANMEEYYYCSAYFPNGLLKMGVRFEFVLKETPYVGIPKGAQGKDMSRVIEVAYGSEQHLKFSVVATASVGFVKNMVQDNWMCRFNGKKMEDNWRQRCTYMPQQELVQFSIDHTVLGDQGYYQIIAGNDEGWAIGPPILLVVYGSEPEEGQYILTMVSKTTDAITVRWHRPPKSNIINPEYILTLENMDFEEQIDDVKVVGIEEAVIRPLRPGVRYGITVSLNGGLVADTKYVRTVPIRTSAQVSISCDPSATVIQCSWSDPDPSSIHGAELYFLVRISTKNRLAPVPTNETRIDSSRKSSRNRITITNLLPYTIYYLSVVPCNEEGCSERQNQTTEFRTDEEIPSEVRFRSEPRTAHVSIAVSMLYPPILPGRLKTEVVIYEEKEIRSMTARGKRPCGHVPTNIHDSNHTVHNTTGIRPRQVFDKADFVLDGLQQSTTYYLRFQWTTKAGSGPLSSCFQVKIGRYVNITNMLIGCGVALFVIVLFTGFFFYVNRKYPGLFKVVLAKVRDHLQPSYMQPTDPFEEFQNQEEDLNIVYEFDGPGEVYYLS